MPSPPRGRISLEKLAEEADFKRSYGAEYLENILSQARPRRSEGDPIREHEFPTASSSRDGPTLHSVRPGAYKALFSEIPEPLLADAVIGDPEPMQKKDEREKVVDENDGERAEDGAQESPREAELRDDSAQTEAMAPIQVPKAAAAASSCDRSSSPHVPLSSFFRGFERSNRKWFDESGYSGCLDRLEELEGIVEDQFRDLSTKGFPVASPSALGLDSESPLRMEALNALEEAVEMQHKDLLARGVLPCDSVKIFTHPP